MLDAVADPGPILQRAEMRTSFCCSSQHEMPIVRCRLSPSLSGRSRFRTPPSRQSSPCSRSAGHACCPSSRVVFPVDVCPNDSTVWLNPSSSPLHTACRCARASEGPEARQAVPCAAPAGASHRHQLGVAAVHVCDVAAVDKVCNAMSPVGCTAGSGRRPGVGHQHVLAIAPHGRARATGRSGTLRKDVVRCDEVVASAKGLKLEAELFQLHA